MTAAFSCATIHLVVAMSYRRFGTTYKPHFQGSKIPQICTVNHNQKKG